jgi:hypothetical protein
MTNYGNLDEPTSKMGWDRSQVDYVGKHCIHKNGANISQQLLIETRT